MRITCRLLACACLTLMVLACAGAAPSLRVIVSAGPGSPTPLGGPHTGHVQKA